MSSFSPEINRSLTSPTYSPDALEEDLIDFFPELVDGLSFDQLAVRAEGQKVIHHPEAFGFVALFPSTGYCRPIAGTPITLMSSGYVNLNRADPKLDFYRRGGRAFLDTRQAVGLAYDKKLVAVGGAGIDSSGSVKITQLQDVSDVRKRGRGSDYYKTGLQNGLLWRQTLVRAWEQIGNELGAEQILIQSSRNTSYGTVAEIPEHLTTKNDQVAAQMEYYPDPQSYDWFRSLVSY